MTKSVKYAAKQLFDKQRLSEEGLQRIRDLSMNDDIQSQKRKSGRNKESLERVVRWGMVASIVILSIGLGMIGINQYQHHNRVELIVAEVVKNHGNLKPLEVNSSRFSEVVGYFDQLSFLPSVSQWADVSEQLGNRLIGGRYCSIQGFTAAQLRMDQQHGQFSTLFQTQDADEFAMIPDIRTNNMPLVSFNKGYQVSMWREKGLLMVLVEPAATQF